MTDLNPNLVSALGKLNIEVESYEENYLFQSLPISRYDHVWKELKNPPYGLPLFELMALKNARCSSSLEGKIGIIMFRGKMQNF
jgi:hypothetical protein